MRILLFFAVLGLIVMEAFLLPHTVRDFRTMRKMRVETASEDGRPVALSPFAGYDVDGRPLTLVTDDTRWIVPFVIHADRMSADLDYLSRLRKALPRRTLALVGVCDQSRCSAASQSEQAHPDFPVLVYGSYAPLKDIARFDDRNQVLLMNQFWGVNKSLPRAASAEEMATTIQQVIGQ
ncbi:MAG TPA: hypothetical protein VI636_14320 [Candidatus Angelobacter sp.]